MGSRALLVMVDDAAVAVAVRETVLRLADDTDLPGPRDVVPAARSVLVDGLPGPEAVRSWRDRLSGLEELIASEPIPGRDVTIDVRYDGADREVVAAAWGCSGDAVVDRHVSAGYLVAFCGFAPGFAYCTAFDPMPEVPRRDAPRERVPAGSVGLAGPYCGVYPSAMPGGWQLIGRTTETLFDPERERPALLTPGDRVRFRAVR
jgi:KipI family sensor histidine kinase inhibitor